MAELGAEWGVPCAVVPGGLQPRAALGYLFGATAGAFGSCGLAREGIAGEAASGVELVDRDGGRRAGPDALETVPLIYGAGPMAAVAYRWKTQLNENAKMHAFSHAFPELDHNEIVGWEGGRSGRFSAVILRDPSEQTETRRMIEVTGELIAGDAVVVEHVWGVGETVSARAFSMVAFGDWVSYYAALARGVDPIPVERIGELKRRMGMTPHPLDLVSHIRYISCMRYDDLFQRLTAELDAGSLTTAELDRFFRAQRRAPQRPDTAGVLLALGAIVAFAGVALLYGINFESSLAQRPDRDALPLPGGGLRRHHPAGSERGARWQRDLAGLVGVVCLILADLSWPAADPDRPRPRLGLRPAGRLGDRDRGRARPATGSSAACG